MDSFLHPQIWLFLIPLILWDLFWRGLGLWHASQKEQKFWFVALLLVNSLGLLPLLYLSFFQKSSSNRSKEGSENHFTHYAGFLLISVIVILLFVLRFVLGGPEDTWIYQKGQWIKHGRPSSAKPLFPPRYQY
jgi:hypothetical protein